MGSECHQQLTGRDNQQIKRSICLLAERGKLAELRLLVIPGQVDYLQHIEELAALIKGLGDVPVRLNAFHAHGVYGEAQAGRAPRRRMWNNWLMRYGSAG